MVRLMHMTLTESQAQGPQSRGQRSLWVTHVPYVCRDPQRPEESVRSTGTGVTGCYELLGMGAGNRTPDLQKRSKCSNYRATSSVPGCLFVF